MTHYHRDGGDESADQMRLVIGHLYPAIMNLYGDRGNILYLRHRCERRGIQVEVKGLGIGQGLTPDTYDLLFIGGGQDREQKRVAEDLQGDKAEAIKEAVGAGVVVLAICGGYQLLGHYYRPADGPDLPGIGLFDALTIHKGAKVPRCIGNVLVSWHSSTLVGFENHGGRTYLGKNAEPLGRVLRGHGNNGDDGTEGAVYKNAFGTYLHGAFLPKNPRFTDFLLKLALERKYGSVPLASLDDSLEMQAHEAIVKRLSGVGSLWKR